MQGADVERLAPDPHDASAAPPRPRAVFRPDIEGLRALAVVLVVSFHAGFPLLPGGYLGEQAWKERLVVLLVDEVLRTDRISIPTFYARRARRLLPMAALVIVVTLVASWFVVAPVDLPGVAGAGLAASLFGANLFFAHQSGDYLAGDLNSNPFLHFWSLSVEEQYYLFWPLILIVVLVVTGVARHRVNSGRVLRRAGLAGAAAGKPKKR